MDKLKGKVVLITGGTRGIGKGIARECLKEGAMVLLTYSKDEERANETLKELEKLGTVKIKKSNVASYEECREVIDFTIEKLGNIDVLINNAGISKVGLLMDSSKEDIDKIFSINILGMIYISKLAIEKMISKGGKIINISSIWGESGASCEVLYSATKGAVNLFTKALAKEMAMANIRVNAIAPGVIDTEMNNFLSDEEKELLKEEIPLNRFGKTEEVGKLAVFLASDDSSYITGQVINVDGAIL